MTLRCEHVAKSFDGRCVLADLTVCFPESGVTAIIGPNGAGKSTLLNILTGFVSPDSGRCFLGARETTHLPAHRIAELGAARTFQDIRVIKRMSVLENVLLARPHQRGETLLGSLMRIGIESQERRNRIEALEYLRLVGLESKTSEQAGELSYGEQKLLSFACCLSTEAHILLFDEPVAGVHPEIARRILKLQSRLATLGKVIIFVEHDMVAVRQVSDHVIVMDDGMIIAQGSPTYVLELPEIMDAYVG